MIIILFISYLILLPLPSHQSRLGGSSKGLHELKVFRILKVRTLADSVVTSEEKKR